MSRYRRVGLGPYMRAALGRARFDQVDGLGWSARIPRFPGLVVSAPSKAVCQQRLRAALEEWILTNIRRRERLPLIGGLKVNGGVY